MALLSRRVGVRLGDLRILLGLLFTFDGPFLVAGGLLLVLDGPFLIANRRLLVFNGRLSGLVGVLLEGLGPPPLREGEGPQAAHDEQGHDGGGQRRAEASHPDRGPLDTAAGQGGGGPLVQGLQPFHQLRGAGQPGGRIAVHALADVVPQQPEHQLAGGVERS